MAAAHCGALRSTRSASGPVIPTANRRPRSVRAWCHFRNVGRQVCLAGMERVAIGVDVDGVAAPIDGADLIATFSALVGIAKNAIDRARHAKRADVTRHQQLTLARCVGTGSIHFRNKECSLSQKTPARASTCRDAATTTTRASGNAAWPDRRNARLFQREVVSAAAGTIEAIDVKAARARRRV